jgi:hypothetical protein
MDSVLVAVEVVLEVVKVTVAAEVEPQGTQGLILEKADLAGEVTVQAVVAVVVAVVAVVGRVTLPQGAAVLEYLALAVVVLAAQAIPQAAQQFVAVVARAVQTALLSIVVVFMGAAQVHYSVAQIIMAEELLAELSGPAQLVNIHQLVHRTYK